MAGIFFSGPVQYLSINILVLPGFNEGLGRRGAWFGVAENFKTLLKYTRKKGPYLFRYVIHQPDSEIPLSDGEVQALAGEAVSSIDRYSSELQRLEMTYKRVRRQGKMNALLYILGILAIRWYWWIFLTRGEMSFYNHHNAHQADQAASLGNYLRRVWIHGHDNGATAVLNECAAEYRKSGGSPITRYRTIQEYCLNKCRNSDAIHRVWWRMAADGYGQILGKLTGHSFAVQLLPTSFKERLANFFLHSYRIPKPETVFPVRNLEKSLLLYQKTTRTTINDRVHSIDGNAMDLYLLAAKDGVPIVVPGKDYQNLSRSFSRLEQVLKRDLPLQINLHVGSMGEKRIFSESCDRESGQRLYQRLQNAVLDTQRQGETIIAYYYREQPRVMIKRFQVRFPFRSRLHGLFPWLFITNGIPVASLLAAVWLFIDPMNQGQTLRSYRSYFSSILEGIDLAYHNIQVQTVFNPALGHLNTRILQNQDNQAWRAAAVESGSLGLPVSLTDRALWNNLVMETGQLDRLRKEANNFTTLPLGFVQEGQLDSVGNQLFKEYGL